MTNNTSTPTADGQARGIKTAEAAKIVGVSPATFRKMVKAGDMPSPFIDTPRLRVWNQAEIVAAMTGKTVAAGDA
jgi:predicted DNA-binding transcriptional regulator AlpA